MFGIFRGLKSFALLAGAVLLVVLLFHDAIAQAFRNDPVFQQSGRLVAQGSVDDVVGGLHRIVRLDTDQPEAAVGILTALGVADVHLAGGTAVGELGDVAPEKIVATCVHQGLAVTGFQVAAPALEEAFVALTGEGFEISG